MPVAVLYRWRLKPGKADAFRAAWVEGTRRIHEACGSFGARLHEGDDGLFRSYACWPSDAARERCFAEHDWFGQDCFVRMQACIAERFPEVRLTVTDDELHALAARPDVPDLDTGRLRLRALTPDDAASLLPAFTDEANMRYWSRGPVEDVAALRRYMHWNVYGHDVRCFAITRKGAEDAALGWVALVDVREGVGEIGFVLRPDAQGEGLAREAVARVVDHAFADRGLWRIQADTDPDNAPSIALLESLGFEREGRLRAAWRTHIGVRDALILARVAAG